jgi:hypothetical protein
MSAPKVWLGSRPLQRRFNKGRYVERLRDGELHVGIVEPSGPSPKGSPKGTRSQMVEFLDRWDNTVVWAHQIAGRPNGQAAEGTCTDPKYIFEGGVRYKHAKGLDWMPPDHPGFPHPWGTEPENAG